MVEDEEDKGNHFQQGLKPKIRKFLASQQLDTYSQVLTAARKVEIEFEDDDKETEPHQVEEQQKLMKRPFEQTIEEVPHYQYKEQPAKRQLQLPVPIVICGFCKKPGHHRNDCRMAKGLCLVCGAAGHRAANCPYSYLRNNVPTPLAAEYPGPADRGAPLPRQQQEHHQVPRGAEAGQGPGQPR